MENLQDEVLEIEFMEFSRGMATISEEDFARILLRYTMLDKGDIETCINRVRERMPQEKVINMVVKGMEGQRNLNDEHYK